MKCPNCNVDLLMTERLNEQIDYCPQCRGTWLEKGKLEKLMERSSSGQQVSQNKDLSQDRNRNRNNDDDEGKGGFLGNLFDL